MHGTTAPQQSRLLSNGDIDPAFHHRDSMTRRIANLASAATKYVRQGGSRAVQAGTMLLRAFRRTNISRSSQVKCSFNKIRQKHHYINYLMH